MRLLRFIVGLAAIPILFMACQSDTLYIKGEAWQLPNGSVLYLSDDIDGAGRPLDSIVVADGRFYFQGHAAEPTVCRLYPADSHQQGIVFFAEPGNIYIELLPKPGSSRVSGTTINNRWQSLNDSVAKYDHSIRSIIASGSDSISPRQRFVDIERQYVSLTRLIKETALRNRDNALGRFINNHYQGD